MLRNPIVRFFGIAIVVVIVAVIGLGAAFVFVARDRLEEATRLATAPTPPPVPTAFPTPRPPLPEDQPSEDTSVIGQTTVQPGSVSVPGIGQDGAPTLGLADNVIPGDPTNIYGQKVYADLEALVEGSDLIVFVRIDGDGIRPKPPVPYLHQVSGHLARRLLILFTVVFVSDYNLANTTIAMLDLQG